MAMSADNTRDALDARNDSAPGDTRKENASAGTRAQILAAAAELAREKGAAHISIEAIAQRAGLSKGGLLYHFPRKDALIQALVELHMAEVEAELASVEATSGRRRTNAVARALVEMHRDKACRQHGKLDGVLVALAENPHLLDPVRAHQKRVVERIRNTAADRELSLIALLAVEGMRSLDLLEARALTPEEGAAVLDRILALLADDHPGTQTGPTG